MNKIFAVFAVGSAVVLSGCEQKQFVKGHFLKPSETVFVETLPQGATVTSNFGQSCTTPCYIPLLRAKGGDLTISKDGFHTERIFVTSSVDGRRVAHRALDNAVAAIDPDPVDMVLSSFAQLADGKGGVMSLDHRDFALELVPLEEGEIDRGAPPVALTGERLTLEQWETAQQLVETGS